MVIVGAGNIGQQIGAHYEIHGFEVVQYDIEKDISIEEIDRAWMGVLHILNQHIAT